MREYKFRGQTENGEWCYGYYVGIRKEGSPRYDSPTVIEFAEIVDKDHITHRVRPETVGQYTGLKDCKGREIYEGDILEIDNTYFTKISPKEPKTIHGAVEYRPCNFYVAGYGELSASGICPYAVIGNVHDNPELLIGGD